jgi:hypothetical protein
VRGAAVSNPRATILHLYRTTKLSYREIGEQVGVNRNVVAGIISRSGERKAKPPKVFIVKAVAPSKPRVFLEKPVTMRRDILGCQHIAGDPRTDATKCGKNRMIRTNGSPSSYCAGHHALLTVEPLPRTGKKTPALQSKGMPF